MRRAYATLCLLALAAPLGGACATIGSPAGGDVGLPTANVGPFRALTTQEEPDAPSFVLDSISYQFREPSALAVDPADHSSMDVYLYAVATVSSGGMSSDVILRTRAADGRSFYGTSLDPDSSHVPPVVLSATLPWEGPAVSGPSALRVGSEIYLYYAAAGGIGLARSSDGLHFDKTGAPVLASDSAAAWETTSPSAPSVAVLPDGTFDMMYSAGVSIGEATSLDGITFTRIDADPSTPGLDPVLSPLGGAPAAPDAASGPFDTGQVADPCVLPYVSPAGRLVVRVLYTGYDGPPSDASRSSAIGLAGRFGTQGRLVRQPLPVFSVMMHEAAPTYFRWSAGEMLYVQAERSELTGSYASIVAGVAPVSITLSTPTAFASSP
jgi:hypothetical protein